MKKGGAWPFIAEPLAFKSVQKSWEKHIIFGISCFCKVVS